jgi:hypothetical protein
VVSDLAFCGAVVEDLNKRRQPLTLDAIYFIQPTRNRCGRTFVGDTPWAASREAAPRLPRSCHGWQSGDATTAAMDITAGI